MNINKNHDLTHILNATRPNWQDWRWQFKNRITNPAKLQYFAHLLSATRGKLDKTIKLYPMAITPYYFSLISEDINDPVKAQCFPDIRESLQADRGMEDPLEEDSHMPVPKLIHRYPDRCLMLVTETCATYCRHCNRKRFWVSPKKISLKARLAKMINHIAASPQIREVIISGGDPLTLDDQVLEKLLSSLKSIPHVEILRIGSRTPVVMPMRITKELCRILKCFRPLWFNTQFNHPQEITPESERACNMLLEAGIPVSNQSVLLKGINDKADVMQRLLHDLQKISVRPYYLFHCDPVAGCEHFRTEAKESMQMMEKIWRHSSGLCLPKYVLDVPGNTGKIPLSIMSRSWKKDLQKHQHFFDKST